MWSRATPSTMHAEHRLLELMWHRVKGSPAGRMQGLVFAVSAASEENQTGPASGLQSS